MLSPSPVFIMKTKFGHSPVASEWKVLHQKTRVISSDKSKDEAVKQPIKPRNFLVKLVSSINKFR
jgi:hypothetical protein